MVSPPKHRLFYLDTELELTSVVNRPLDGSFATTRVTLLNIVCLSLNQDPALQPRSAKTLAPSASVSELNEDEDQDSSESLTPTSKPDLDLPSSNPSAEVEEEEEDDFIIMSEKQARRIVSLTKAAFDVDLSMDVVVAEPNVGALARRVMGAKSLRSGG